MINTTENTAQDIKWRHWSELQWERDLERILEDFKYQLREKLRTAYYTNTRSAELFGRGRMSGPRIENEREKIARIADALRSASGWASTRAVWEQYRAEGGTRGYRSVADDLKVLGKTNPEPAPMRTSRAARDEQSVTSSDPNGAKSHH